jgi:hypothetical protein
MAHGFTLALVPVEKLAAHVVLSDNHPRSNSAHAMVVYIVGLQQCNDKVVD